MTEAGRGLGNISLLTYSIYLQAVSTSDLLYFLRYQLMRKRVIDNHPVTLQISSM